MIGDTQLEPAPSSVVLPKVLQVGSLAVQGGVLGPYSALGALHPRHQAKGSGVLSETRIYEKIHQGNIFR